MLDVRKLVRHHAAQFACTQQLQYASRRRNRRVLRIAAGCERVGLRFIDDIDPGHRQSGALRELSHDAVKLRRACSVDFLRVVHLQHHLVRKPVGEEIHRAAKHQRDQHALSTADRRADHAK